MQATYLKPFASSVSTKRRAGGWNCFYYTLNISFTWVKAMQERSESQRQGRARQAKYLLLQWFTYSLNIDNNAILRHASCQSNLLLTRPTLHVVTKHASCYIFESILSRIYRIIVVPYTLCTSHSLHPSEPKPIRLQITFYMSTSCSCLSHTQTHIHLAISHFCSQSVAVTNSSVLFRGLAQLFFLYFVSLGTRRH